MSPLSSTSIDVLWTVPDQPNGIIIGYFIFRDGNQIGEILNVLTFTDTSLSPFTSYSYLIQACTSAGCTNSTEITNTTLEAPPTGFDDPIISNVDSNSLMISWIPPSNPNGHDLEYTVYFANGTIVFNGSNTSTIVQGLLPFTNYTLGVTVCNNAGCTESDTVNAQTDETAPVGLAVPMVRDLSSFSVEISWQPPSMANGIILYYILRRDSKDVFEGLTLEFDDEELEGDTQYVYELEAFNSAGSVTSPTITIHTQPDLPSGVNPPITTVLNSTAIFVQWSEPAKTNGDIMEYRLVVNNVIMFSGLSFNHTLMNLTAFTTYMIYVEVCNQAGCASSKSVSNTTNEDLPIGVSPPVVTALSGTSILVSWSAPTMPNGIITEYRVFRREADNPLFILIQYVGGANVLSFTNQGVNPFTTYEYQLVVYNSIGSTESEFVEVTTLEAPPTGLYPPTFPVVMATHLTVSWSEPTNPNGILLQYELFYRLLLGELMSAVTVPANTTQFNITGLEPNTIYEFKVRVTNGAGSGDSDFELAQTAESSPEDLGPLILVTKTSESLTLTWNSPGKPNGVITSYALFLNGEEEHRDTDSIYTIDRLKPFTGYSIQLEACTSAGCTRGTTQGFITEESTPIGQPAPTLSIIDARSVTITWDFPIQSNGIISSYDIFRMEVLEPLVMNNTDEATLIYTTTDVAVRIFNDTTLFPDTGYQYAVRANNSVGYSLSAFTYIQTPEAAPEFIPSPELEVLGISEIKVTWDPPGQTNGELTQYRVYKISPVNIITIEYTGFNREFTDSDLIPFSQYSYFIEACTNAGCTNGTSTAATTDESVPEDIIAPVLKALSESAISITWIPPSIPNGILISYIINIVEPVSITVTTEPNKLSVNISSLQPYTDYTVHLQACTSAGCTVSDTSAIQTLESIPFFIDPPLVFALGPISVDTSWSDPAQPNGVIIRYILRRNDTIVYDGTNKSFIDENLLPNQAYAYDVQAFTSVGGGERSAFSIVTTHSDTPTDVAPPNLSALDSFSVLAQWTVPGVTNGVIQQYILYVNESVVYNSTGFGFVVTDLMIFTTYAFRVEACTTTCGSSLYSYVTTLEAPPEGQTPPTLSLTTNGSVLVTWSPPSTPNGIIKTYLVERRQVLEGGQFGPGMSIATNIPSSLLHYLDDDNANLAPAMIYSYRVTVSNSVGSDTSEYVSITLPEAAPESISAPALINKTSTSITVSVSPPTTPNGLITQYTLFGSNLFSIVKIPSSQTDPVTFIHIDLQPYTEYTLYVEACTSAGCTIGPPLTVLTNEDTPVGLLSPIVTVEGARSIRIEWTLPSQPNGIITRYDLCTYIVSVT